MLNKNDRGWSGQLGDINVTEVHIDLVLDYKPFKPSSFHAGRNNHKLERGDVNKQLNTGVIDPSMSEWATPVLFCTEKVWQATLLYQLHHA